MNCGRKIKFFILLISIVIISNMLYSQSESAQPLVTINLRDVPCSHVLKVLGEKTGLKFVADPEIQDRRISVNLTSVTAEDAINAILSANSLGYRKLEGMDIYFVGDIRKIQRETNVKSIRCQFADALELQGILNRIVTPGVGVVVAEQRTNTLILRDNPETLNRLEELLKTLDAPTSQIYIQAAIAEISLTKDNTTGIEWLWKNPNFYDTDIRSATRFDLRQTVENPNYFDNAGERIGKGLPIGMGLGVGVLTKRFDAVLHALTVEKDVNILSRPYLVTLDNKEAVIEVGDQIPYKVLNQYGITSYEFKAATIRLKVKAHINNDQTLTIEVTPNADFENGQTPDGIPIIAKRMANTTIIIGNQETIVIGGLMRETRGKTISRVPLLGAIPLIGMLFKNKGDQRVKTELVVFINPTIVTDQFTKTKLQPENVLSDQGLKKIGDFKSVEP
jgi:type IV pilus assembly protein PilQ